jgi:hypothetical protein
MEVNETEVVVCVALASALTDARLFGAPTTQVDLPLLYYPGDTQARPAVVVLPQGVTIVVRVAGGPLPNGEPALGRELLDLLLGPGFLPFVAALAFSQDLDSDDTDWHINSDLVTFGEQRALLLRTPRELIAIAAWDGICDLSTALKKRAIVRGSA